MPGKIKVANDLGTQQRHDVRANRKLESAKNFFGARGAAEDVTAFQNQYFLSRFREISGVSEAVMASANNNYIVLC